MTRRGLLTLLGLALAALAAAVCFALSEPSTPVSFAGADALAPAGAPALPSPGTSVSAPRESVDARPSDLGPPAAAAEPEPASGSRRPSDWRAKWDRVPLDATGRSIKGKGRTTAFNRALHAAIKQDLVRCLEAYPPRVTQLVNMEVYVEANASGYDVIGAEAQTDAGLEDYVARCFELAFETRLELPDAGTTAGELFHFSYPIQLNAVAPEDAGDATPR